MPMKTEYDVGDIIVIFGRSAYDAPSPFCFYSYVYEAWTDENGPVVVVYDPMRCAFNIVDVERKMLGTTNDQDVEVVYHESGLDRAKVHGRTVWLSPQLADNLGEHEPDGERDGGWVCELAVLADGRLTVDGEADGGDHETNRTTLMSVGTIESIEETRGTVNNLKVRWLDTDEVTDERAYDCEWAQSWIGRPPKNGDSVVRGISTSGVRPEWLADMTKFRERSNEAR